MKKIIKQLNNSTVITFTKEERKIYDLNIGDIVEVNIEHEEINK